MDKVLDALIIGGGPAGATTGLLLAQAGWSVGIAEKKNFPRRKVCGEFMSATNSSLLQQLGIADYYCSASGPEIQRVGLFAAETILATNMPTLNDASKKWGRALGREHLDMVLLNRAAQLGAIVWQPGTVQNVQRHAGLFTCILNIGDKVEKISARLVIMASGSWEGSPIPSKVNSHKPSDLLAFKAHFRDCDLASDLMPLIAFPGGYGGLVHSDNGRVSLSYCIRRDVLQGIRQQHAGMSAGEASLNYIKTKCLGVRKVLTSAHREGSWLACGPIRPGIRQRYHEGIFFVGNIAGEAHPIVAEGISMAMQSAWLLSQILIRRQKEIVTEKGLRDAGKEYSNQWHKHFATRIHAAALFSLIAMRPWSQAIMLFLIKRFPGLLTFGAKLSGKIQQVVVLETTNSFNKDN
ncbi:NAD(P)/FAD-dependent oxidoreductase [Legionella maioricensis]|uniref:Protein CbrA n=1 Tax=Legionella maioricensis TaxID=2896528 RepID=A0A9X2D208_9GAMM|nr:FAD-dependent monooxygenase [Legionella maioricensis]MCL9684827.1 FAD-dependent monooxygenase [Legionella maioricensis]MCL9688507.1 FAD-dependent monooxygenase [Legionella maioricensis]